MSESTFAECFVNFLYSEKDDFSESSAPHHFELIATARNVVFKELHAGFFSGISREILKM